MISKMISEYFIWEIGSILGVYIRCRSLKYSSICTLLFYTPCSSCGTYLADACTRFQSYPSSTFITALVMRSSSLRPP